MGIYFGLNCSCVGSAASCCSGGSTGDGAVAAAMERAGKERRAGGVVDGEEGARWEVGDKATGVATRRGGCASASRESMSRSSPT